MSKQELKLPLATEDQQNNGWTLEVDFLKAIESSAQVINAGEMFSLDAVESVLLAALEAHLFRLEMGDDSLKSLYDKQKELLAELDRKEEPPTELSDDR